MDLPYTSASRMQVTGLLKMLADKRPHIRLASLQGDQCAIAGIGDGDNSLSMRRVKSGAWGAMIHAAGAGGGWHCAAWGNVAGLEED
ncbi:Lipoprotein [Pseudomonas sp. IT-P12]